MNRIGTTSINYRPRVWCCQVAWRGCQAVSSRPRQQHTMRDVLVRRGMASYSSCRRRSHVTGRLPEVPVVVYTVHVSDSGLIFDHAQTYCRRNDEQLVLAITSAHQQKRWKKHKAIGRTERPLFCVDWCPVRRREHNSSLPFFLHFAAQESVSALHRPKFCSVVKGSWILLAVDVG